MQDRDGAVPLFTDDQPAIGDGQVRSDGRGGRAESGSEARTHSVNPGRKERLPHYTIVVYRTLLPIHV